MALATLFVTMPFVVRELIPILDNMDLAEEEAARTMGASDLQVFWNVTLPNIRYGLLYGIILTNAVSTPVKSVSNCSMVQGSATVGLNLGAGAHIVWWGVQPLLAALVLPHIYQHKMKLIEFSLSCLRHSLSHL